MIEPEIRPTPERHFSEGEKVYLATALTRLVQQWESPDFEHPRTINRELHSAINGEVRTAYPIVETIKSCDPSIISTLKPSDWLGIQETNARLERLYKAYEGPHGVGQTEPVSRINRKCEDNQLDQQLVEAFRQSDEYAEAKMQADIDRLNSINAALSCPELDFDPSVRPLITEAKAEVRALCASPDNTSITLVYDICEAVITLHLIAQSARFKDESHLRFAQTHCVILLGKWLYDEERSAH